MTTIKINKVVKPFSLEYYLEQIKALHVKTPTIKSIMMESYFRKSPILNKINAPCKSSKRFTIVFCRKMSTKT